MKKILILFIICLTTLMVYQTLAQVHDAPGNAVDESDTSSVTQKTAPIEEGDCKEEEDFGSILLSLVIILMAAKIGGDLCERVKQPAVLGELVFGVILGNIYLLGFGGFEQIKHHISIEILAEIGVIILLFEVGLETSIKEMLSVGLVSFLVAILGVVTPFLLGWGVSVWFLPEASIYVHIFIGATLTATSVGITARVLSDMGRLRYRESKIILGAAVIDDVLGLVILSIVTGIISAAGSGNGGGISSLAVLLIIPVSYTHLTLPTN